RKDAQAAAEILEERLKSHPAGPIELHSSKVTNAHSLKVMVLGYWLEPGKGHGTHYVHVKPGPKRIERFKQNLACRLENAGSEDDLYDVGCEYWKHWFASQAAWT